MKKNIWIWNHYATNMYSDKAGRHYWFAEHLIEKGYNPTIFCASTNHFTGENIDAKGNNYILNKEDKVPFVFVDTPKYIGNGKKRIKNMIAFYKKLFPVALDYAEKYEKPDIILASSVHPLTLVAGIKIANKFGVPCICEIRDLWPESLVAYGFLKRESIITKLLYQGEKWIYKKADSIIMTWEGGKDYIIEKGWERFVDLNKVYYISNGINIESFDYNSERFQINDSDLVDTNYKNIVYTGSIRRVNNIGLLLDVAKLIQDKGYDNIRFLIYGSGDEKQALEKRIKCENINNVIFKGRVDKKFIPYVLKKAYINILHNTSTSLDKYGQSQNKLFEYLAAGKCIIQTYTNTYSILEKYNCGMSASVQNPDEIANIIIEASKDEKRCKLMGENARKAAYEFDFEKLTDKLIDIIENFQ